MVSSTSIRIWTNSVTWLLIISIIVLNRTIKHSFSDKQLIASFNVIFFSFYLFVWYFIFFFLIGIRPVLKTIYDTSIVLIPLVTIFFSSQVVLVGSIIWFLVRHNKQIKNQQSIEYGENCFSFQKWSVVPLALFGFIFIPIFSILYVISGLMLLRKMKNKSKIKIIAFSTILFSLLSLALLITAISIKLNYWWLIGKLPYASYVPIATGFILLLLSISLFLLFIESFQGIRKAANY
ncbi:MAG: hypothetical protein HZR80_19595 [Candidatus Heimdallarchaeota archaeon]